MFKFVNNWIEKAVAKEVANQNKSKRWEDIYDKLNLNEVDRQKLLARSFQRTSEDMKPVNAKGHAMDAACVGGSLKNVFGVSNYADDVIFTHFAQQGFIGYQACALLAQNWIINNACSVPCEDAIRPGYEISLNQDIELEDQDLLVKIKQVSERKYNISNIARNFARNNKIFGCALALPVVDGIDYAKPFNIDGVRRGSYKGISLIEPYWVMPELDMEATSAPESLHFYEPTWWRLPNGKRIHRSHVIYITGDEVPDVLKPTYYFGGLPLTQQIYERVYASERVANEAPLMALTKRMLIADGNIEAYLMNEEDAEKKLQKLSYCRDNYGVFFKRPGDNVQQIDTSLTDFDALIMTQYQLVASIARMPATKLLKTQPKGFNATGEYEMKDYIQELQHLQDNQMKPLIERNNLLVEKSEFGYSYELEAKFNPVDMPTERELAEVRKIDADTDMVLINAGAISPEEARARIIADPNSGYNGLPAEMPHSDFMEENFLDDETAAGEQLFGEQPEQTLDAWNEEDHPRDDDGKFGKGGGKAKEHTKESFYGEEFSNVKGKEAISLLLEKQNGHVKGAFSRQDIGDIDLVWGDEKIGLAHIIKQRQNQGIDPEKFLSDLDSVISKGELRFNRNTKRFEISFNGKTAIVSPEFKGEKAQFVLTAFEIKK
jgi:phage-related protein (TIGR01555 family)